MKTGLILEGGAMRGIYTAGVLDVFMEEGIHFDGVLGVSAGAIHGATYVAEQKGRNIRYYKKYCADKRFMSFYNLLKTGDLVGEEFCYHELPDTLDPFDYDVLDQSKTEFYVTCTNVETGKAEYLRMKNSKEEIDLLRASASMPYVTKIVNYKGKKLLDGGCADSIPVKAFVKMGFHRPVIVLTQDKDYVKGPQNPHIAKLFYRKYPEFVKTISRRHLKYNKTREQIEKWEKDGKVFVIRPSQKLTIGRMEHNPEELQRVYDIGVKDAQNCLQELKKFINL
ncbi:MAG: patatin family protein [Lachnospiraceae bacterium]|nr:patatin family protein [Lachnospiraceae bacterium]